MRLNWIDRAVLFMAPKAGLERMRARAHEDLAKRHFEGASTGRRTENWYAPNTSVNAASIPRLQTLRARSRDLARNDGYALNAIDTIATDIIGTGIRPKFIKGKRKAPEIVGRLWREWAEETTECDSEGMHNIYGLQDLAVRTVAESGSVLVRRRWRRPSDNLTVPMQLQLLEPDHLDQSRDGPIPGGSIRAGVEYDLLGRRVAYWLFAEHPGESTFANFEGMSSVRVPAADILHLFRVERTGQVDGIPWLATSIIGLRDLHEFRDARLMREKIAACFVAFVRDSEPPDNGLPQELGKDGTPKPPIERVYPGMFEYLPTGKTIEFGTPPITVDNGNYEAGILRSIAAGAHVPYEALTGNYASMPFSSARMSHLRYAKRIDKWRWNLVQPRLLGPIARWFLEAIALSESITTDGIGARWTAPRREMIDPVAETTAKKEAVRAGFQSLSSVITEDGDEPDDVFEEIAADAEKLDKLKLVVESDARRPSMAQGTAADTTDSSPPTDSRAGDALPADDGSGSTPPKSTKKPAAARK